MRGVEAMICCNYLAFIIARLYSEYYSSVINNNSFLSTVLKATAF